MSVPPHIATQLSGALTRAAGKILPALANAAERTGTDFTALFHTARLESGFNPQAKATTSSATGLFQFIDSTWLSTLAKHGPRHGITAATRSDALALRRNPEVASLMAAEHMAENKASLEAGLGRPASPSDLYLAHFLGAGGALKFLGNLAKNPEQAAAQLMPAAARANRAIFFDGGTPRSLAAVRQLLEARFTGTATPPIGAATGTSVPPPALAKPTLAATQSMEHLPPALSALLSAAEQDGQQDPLVATLLPPNQKLDPRHAAQAAYLLLAQLGA